MECKISLFYTFACKEIDVLYKIQKFFLVGNVTIHKDTANYQVVSLTDLSRVIEHFNL